MLLLHSVIYALCITDFHLGPLGSVAFLVILFCVRTFGWLLSSLSYSFLFSLPCFLGEVQCSLSLACVIVLLCIIVSVCRRTVIVRWRRWRGEPETDCWVMLMLLNAVPPPPAPYGTRTWRVWPWSPYYGSWSYFLLKYNLFFFVFVFVMCFSFFL